MGPQTDDTFADALQKHENQKPQMNKRSSRPNYGEVKLNHRAERRQLRRPEAKVLLICIADSDDRTDEQEKEDEHEEQNAQRVIEGEEESSIESLENDL